MATRLARPGTRRTGPSARGASPDKIVPSENAVRKRRDALESLKAWSKSRAQSILFGTRATLEELGIFNAVVALEAFSSHLGRASKDEFVSDLEYEVQANRPFELIDQSYAALFNSYADRDATQQERGAPHLFFVVLYFARQSILYLTGETPRIDYDDKHHAHIIKSRSNPVRLMSVSLENNTVLMNVGDITINLSSTNITTRDMFTLDTVCHLCLSFLTRRQYLMQLSTVSMAVSTVIAMHFPNIASLGSRNMAEFTVQRPVFFLSARSLALVKAGVQGSQYTAQVLINQAAIDVVARALAKQNVDSLDNQELPPRTINLQQFLEDVSSIQIPTGAQPAVYYVLGADMQTWTSTNPTDPHIIRSPYPGMAAVAAMQSACALGASGASGPCVTDPLTEFAKQFVEINFRPRALPLQSSQLAPQAPQAARAPQASQAPQAARASQAARAPQAIKTQKASAPSAPVQVIDVPEPSDSDLSYESDSSEPSSPIASSVQVTQPVVRQPRMVPADEPLPEDLGESDLEEIEPDFDQF